MSTISIHYLGHSATCISTPKGTQLLIDPFLSGNPLCPDPEQSFEKLAAIALTHGHADHVGDTLRLAKEYGCKVCANYELANLLIKDGVPSGNVEYMNKGGTIELDGYSLTLGQAFHSSSYDAVNGETYYAGEAGSIIVAFANGPTIYHAGDTLLFSDMSLIAKEHAPDIALLPIGDRFTMGPTQAAEAARLIGAKRVIPIHYKTMDILSGTVEAFQAALESDDIEVCALEPGESLSC